MKKNRRPDLCRTNIKCFRGDGVIIITTIRNLVFKII